MVETELLSASKVNTHDFKLRVGSNIMTVTGSDGRYSFTNKRGNYAGKLTAAQILALASVLKGEMSAPESE